MEQQNSQSGQDKTDFVKDSVEHVKQRIIATGKLMKYLQNAKNDLDDKNQQITGLKSNLTTSVNAMQAADLKTKTQQAEIDTLKGQVKSLQTQINETNSATGSTQELEAQLKTLENERNENQRLAQSRQTYIQQLEAQCEQLRESSNQQSEKAKSSSKQSAELKKKKEEIAALKQRLTTAEKKVDSLSADIGRIQEEKEALDEDMIEMKMNNDMVENELDELKESLKDMIPKEELEKQNTDYNYTISNLKKQLELPRKQIEDLKKLNELKDLEITKLKSEKLQLKDQEKTKVSQLELPIKQIEDLKKRIELKDLEITKLKNENLQLKNQERTKVSQIELPRKQIEDLKKRNELKDLEITKLKSENLQLKDQEGTEDSLLRDQEIIKLKRDNTVLKEKLSHMPKRSTEIPKVSPQMVNQDLVKRFHKARGECLYYQRLSKRFAEQLKELSIRESLSYGLDDIENTPDSPITADFSEDELEAISPVHPKSPEPRSIASLMNGERASYDSSIGSVSPSPTSPTSQQRSGPSQPSSPTSQRSGPSQPSSPTSQRRSILSQPTSPPVLASAHPTEKEQLRRSGLIPPPPNVNTTATGRRKSLPKGKNKQSKLMKFVNARNSEKMLNSKPLPVPITPTVTQLQQLAKMDKPTASNVRADKPTTSNVRMDKPTTSIVKMDKPSTSIIKMDKPTTSIVKMDKPTTSIVRMDKPTTSVEDSPSAHGTKRPHGETQSAIYTKTTEKAVKKHKPVAIDSKFVMMEKLLKTGNVEDLQDIEDIAAHITELLDEIDEMYSTMNSAAEPVNKEPTTVGHPNVLQMSLPQGMVQREKSCILLVCLLAKHYRAEYEALVKGIFSRLYTCENDKPINNKLIRYVRLIVAMAKFNNQPELVFSYIYRILKSRNKNSNVIAALLNVFYIYKECLSDSSLSGLQHDSNHQSESTLLSNTLQACTAHIIRSNGTPANVKSMYDKLIQGTGWSNQIKINACIDDALNILKSPTYLEIFQKPEEYKEVRRSIVMSIELCLTVGHTWEYTYDTFIRQKLWPLLTKRIVNDVAIELLGTLGSTGVSHDPFKPDKPGVVTLLNKLIQIVEWPHPMPKEERHIQDTAANSILAIAGNQPQYKKFVNDYYADKK